MLEKCFKILANLFNDCYKCLRMLTNPYGYRCELYERELRMKQQHDTCVAYLHIHIAGSVLFVFYLLGSPLSAYSPIILILVVRIISLYYENINTNASESLQTSYDHYKCVVIDQNGLRTASEYVANMRLYEF